MNKIKKYEIYKIPEFCKYIVNNCKTFIEFCPNNMSALSFNSEILNDYMFYKQIYGYYYIFLNKI